MSARTAGLMLTAGASFLTTAATPLAWPAAVALLAMLTASARRDTLARGRR